MAKYIDRNSNITFNNVSEISTNIVGAPISIKNNYTFNDDETEITNIDSKVFNAVDIDWNGAKPGIGEDSTNGITTTVELLPQIKGTYSPMFAN